MAAALAGRVGSAIRSEAGEPAQLWVAIPGDPIVRISADLVTLENSAGSATRVTSVLDLFRCQTRSHSFEGETFLLDQVLQLPAIKNELELKSLACNFGTPDPFGDLDQVGGLIHVESHRCK